MSDADIGHGAVFKRGDGEDPEVFTSIGEVLNITPPSITKDVIDATHTGSPDRYREFIVGLRDGGEASVEIQFKPDSPAVANMIADCESDQPVNYQIDFDGGTTVWDFAGLATAFEPSIPVDDKMTATFTVKVTGRPAFASA
ncbi:MAG TPA: outer capsid protein Hoc [Alphaproteobacteria bacterium]|nr:outer capsid protein Hoc [Alphaproteobacteria bacterium]